MRRTTIWTTTATLAALALAGCSLGADDGPPEAYAHVTEALDSLPDAEPVGALRFDGDVVQAAFQDGPQPEGRSWNQDSATFEFDHDAYFFGPFVPRDQWPWEEIWGHVAEASEECDAPGVTVHPLRAGAAAVTTSCSNFADTDTRAWVGDRELEQLEQVFAPETLEQLLDELEVVVGEGTVLMIDLTHEDGTSKGHLGANIVTPDGDVLAWHRPLASRAILHRDLDGQTSEPGIPLGELDTDTIVDALDRAREQAGEDAEFLRAAVGHIDLDPSSAPVVLASNQVTGEAAEVPLHP